MQSQSSPFLKGHFLVAMPELADPNFSQTVTCICEHTAEGAVGLVINRVQGLLSGKLIFEELGIRCSAEAANMPVHIGGPVHVDELFVLHGPPFGWEACMPITASLAMSNTRDIIEAIAMGRGPQYYLLTLGCAGWAPGQLESELKQNAWLTTPAQESIVFETSVEKRWEAVMRQMGIDPLLLASKAGHA
jgi:putative transcriptional regulator